LQNNISANFAKGFMNMKTVNSNNKNRKKYFREIFINLVYDNMAMEDETVFSKKAIVERYKLQINNLILQKSTDEVGRPRLPIADEVSLS